MSVVDGQDHSAKPDKGSDSILRELALILVATDFDSQDHNGQRAGAKAAAWWLKQFHQAERWPVPVGKDPGESFQAGVDLRAWVVAGLPYSLAGRQGATSANQHVEVEQSPDADPEPIMYEGFSESGQRFYFVESDEVRRRVAKDCSPHGVFSFTELERMNGMGLEEVDCTFLVKEVFPEALVEQYLDERG